MALKYGKLRHRIALEAKVQVQDPDTGELTHDWQQVGPILFAEIVPSSAKEFVSAQSLQSSVDTRITIRYRAGVTAEMRVRKINNSALYDINGVLPDADSGIEYLTLPCTSGVNQGG